MTNEKLKKGYRNYRKAKSIISLIVIILTFVALGGFLWVIIKGTPLIGEGLADAVRNWLPK